MTGAGPAAIPPPAAGASGPLIASRAVPAPSSAPASVPVAPRAAQAPAPRAPAPQALGDQALPTPPPGATLVRGEDVLLLSVALPAMSAAQRRAAIGFAVEDHLAQPLDQVHVAPGPQIAPGRWLAGVVGHQALARIAVPPGHRLLPDTLAVPVPDQGWAVLGCPGRVLVRLPDGSGFATEAEAATALWHLAGSPNILSHGGPLPEGLRISATLPLPVPTDAAWTRFDLLSGRSAGQAMQAPRGVVRGLVGLAAFLAGHLLIAGLDLVALSRMQTAREDELRTALTQAGQPVGPDLSASLSQALAGRGAGAAPDGFLDLATRVFAAITDQAGSDQAGQVSVARMSYRAADGRIALTIQAADLAALQGIETALRSGGLDVQAGAATTGDGMAEVQMTIGGAAP